MLIYVCILYIDLYEWSEMFCSTSSSGDWALNLFFTVLETRVGHNPSPRAGRPVILFPLLPANKLIALFLDLSGMKPPRAQLQPIQAQPTCDHRSSNILSVYS